MIPIICNIIKHYAPLGILVQRFYDLTFIVAIFPILQQMVQESHKC